MEKWPVLVGKSFGEIAFMFERAVPLGLRRQTEGMKVELNPPADLLFGPGDELVVTSAHANSMLKALNPCILSGKKQRYTTVKMFLSAFYYFTA
jgi:hypothetical protein